MLKKPRRVFARKRKKVEIIFSGGMYVEDYKRDTTQFKRAVEMNLRESDGLMVFDIVHIIDRDWWGPLQRAVEAYETGEAGR